MTTSLSHVTALRQCLRLLISLRHVLFLVVFVLLFQTSRLLIRLHESYLDVAALAMEDLTNLSINIGPLKYESEQHQTYITESEKYYPWPIRDDGDQRNESHIVVQKDGRYVLSNVFIHVDQVYFVTNDPNITFPPLLCSTVETPFVTKIDSKYCQIQVVSPAQFLQVQPTMEIQKDNILDNAIMLAGLAATNPYHIVWESIIPAYSMLLEDGDLPRDPIQAGQYFHDNSWSIIWTDLDSLTGTLNKNWWNELLPTVLNPTRGPVYLARRLIVGTRGRCAHYVRCSSSGTYYPVDSAIVFRNFIAYTHNFNNSEQGMIVGSTKGNKKNSTCRITVIQRGSTRKILNLDEWVESIKQNDSLGPREVRAVAFENHTIQEQIAISSNTDILILVHGGAFVHLTWLPPGALVVDIQPYGSYLFFPPGLGNWIRFTLSDLHLGYHRIRINYTDGHYVLNEPMTENCVCYEKICHHDVFKHLTAINIDIPIFSNEIVHALEKWRRQTYEEPLPMAAALEMYKRENETRNLAFEKEKEERAAKGLPQRPSCNCPSCSIEGLVLPSDLKP